MEIIIKAEPNEVAELLRAIQGKQEPQPNEWSKDFSHKLCESIFRPKTDTEDKL
jgi:hypothetical protein